MHRFSRVVRGLTSGLAAAFLTVVFLSRPTAAAAAGASLKLSPSSGTYEVGSLVDISMMVDTGGESINAVAATLRFPADKLQVVNPAASTSFISIWVNAPTYSNTDGTVSFQGGLPNPGIKTSAGVISTISFRVKVPGTATLKFDPNASILRNDGQGTNILTSTSSADLTLKVPPPAGPVVSSPTHSDQNAWYNNGQVQFTWEAIDGAVGYSYVFDQSPKTIPNETINSALHAVSVKAANDGIWFFHIRSKTDSWGGVTTFPVQIDTTAPATFGPVIDQDPLTTEDSGIVRFATTDAASGIDHYEVKTVAQSGGSTAQNTLFVEASSPFSLPKLSAGTYTVIVRAIDRAGNAYDGTRSVQVVSGGVPFYSRVPFLRDPAVANAVLIVLGVITTTLLSSLLLRRVRLRATFHHDLEMLEHDAQKKAAVLQRELDELRRAQQMFPAPPQNQPHDQHPTP